MSNCTNLTERATRHKELLNKHIGANVGNDIVEARNNNYPLSHNPDGTPSSNYKKAIALGWSPDEAVLLVADTYSNNFVESIDDTWYEDFQDVNDEPVVSFDAKYAYDNIGTIIDTNEAIYNIDRDTVRIRESNITTVTRVASELSNFNTLNAFMAAKGLINNIVVKYVQEVLKQRRLVSDSGKVLTELDFRAKGLSLDDVDIKAVVIAELSKLVEVYDAAEQDTYGDFIYSIVDDIVGNTESDNVYDDALNELAVYIGVKLDNVAKQELAEQDKVAENDGASGNFMRRLFDREDNTHSQRDSINTQVKQAIWTLENVEFDDDGTIAKVYNRLTGLPEPVDFNSVNITLLEKLSNVAPNNTGVKPDDTKMISITTEEQLISTVKMLSVTMPVMKGLHEALSNDEDLLAAAMYSFRNTQTMGITNRVRLQTNNRLDFDLSLINTPTRFILANEFAETIRYNLSNGFYTSDKLNAIEEALKRNDAIGYAKALQLLGLPFKTYQIELLIDNSLSPYIDINNSVRQITTALRTYNEEIQAKKEEFDNIRAEQLKAIEAGEDIELLDDDIINILGKDVASDVLSLNNENKGKVLGALNGLGLILSDFHMAVFETQFLNANKELEYNVNNPTYIDERIAWFNNQEISGKDFIGEPHKEYINGILKDGRGRFGYWTPSIKTVYRALLKKAKTDSTVFDNNGILNTEHVKDTHYLAILDDLKKITADDYAGVKNEAKGINTKMQNTNYNQWSLSLHQDYMGRVKVLGETGANVRTAGIIQADSSRFKLFRQKRIELFDVDSGVKVTGSKMHRGKNGHIQLNIKDGKDTRVLKILRDSLVNQELHRMIQDKNVMLDNTSKGYVLKEIFKTNPELLQDNEFTIKGEYKDETGKFVGRTFRFHSIPELNILLEREGVINKTTGLVDDSYITLIDDLSSGATKFKNDERTKLVAKIDQAILNFVSDEVDDLHNAVKDDKEAIGNMAMRILYNKTTEADKSYKNYLVELAVNTIISNNEQMYLFQGTTSTHKDNLDVNKRAKKIASPGRAGGLAGLDPNIRMAIIDDVTLKAQYIKQLSTILSDDEVSTLENTKAYKGIDIADAQGYITVDGYAKLLKSWGMFDKYRHYFVLENNQYKLNDSLRQDKLIELLRTIKPFYTNNIFIEELNKYTSIQVKDSLALLIPEFIQGTDLEALNNAMLSQDIEHVVMKSAVKNGIHKVNDVSGNNDTIDPTKLDGLQVINLERAMFRNQVDTVDHHEDSSIKAGIQIFKLITSDIADTLMFDYNGENKDGRFIKDEYNRLINKVVSKNSDKVAKRIREVYNENGEVVPAKLRELLISLGKDVLTDGDIRLLDLTKDKSKFNVPLDMAAKQRFESLLNSMYTKNVTNLKVKGMHSIYMSNAFMDRSNAVSDVAFRDTKDLASDKRNPNSGTLESYYDKTTKKWIYEAYVAPWSKDFYDASGELIPIDDLSVDMRTMLAYRIPTSSRHSAFTIKVVGFTPNIGGSVVVLPHDIVGRTGADFDIDTFYINRKSHEVVSEENIDGKDVVKFDSIKNTDIEASEYNYDRFYGLNKVKRTTYKDAILKQYLNTSNYMDEFSLVQADYNQSIEALRDKYSDSIDAQRVFYGEMWDSIQSEYKVLIDEMVDLSNQWSNGQTDRDVLVALQAENKEKRENVKARLNDIKAEQKSLNLTVSKKSEINNELLNEDNVVDKATYKNIVKDFTAAKSKFTDAKTNLFAKYVDKFLAQGKEEYHDNSVLMNDVLEIMNTIMSNDKLLYGNTLPAVFERSEDEAKNIDRIELAAKGIEDDSVSYNPIKLSTQMKLRERGRLGKEVLGIFANQNTGLVVLQEVKAKLDSKRGKDGMFTPASVSIPYNLNKLRTRYNDYNKSKLSMEQFKKYLISKYGDDINIKNGTVSYKNIGFNNDGSFTNILGQPIVAEFGQLVDHAPDNVKNPLSRNIHPFTTNGLLAYSIGGDVTYGLRVVGQGILTDLLNDYNSNLGARVSANITKRKYYGKILNIIELNRRLAKADYNMLVGDRQNSTIRNILLDILDTNDVTEMNEFLDSINADTLGEMTAKYKLPKQINGKWRVFDKDVERVNKIVYVDGMTDSEASRVGEYKTQLKTYEELEELIEDGEAVKAGNSTLYEMIEYYEAQIDILDRYMDAHDIGKGIGSHINLLNADKVGLGMSITENAEYISNIATFDSPIRILSYKNEGTPTEVMSSIYTSLYANDEGVVSESTYPILDNYIQYSNIRGLIDTMNMTKLNTTNPSYKAMYDIIADKLNLSSKKELNSLISSLNKHIVFNAINQTSDRYGNDATTLLGLKANRKVNVVGIETDSTIVNDIANIDRFKELSLANQIQLLKQELNISPYDKHILALLKPQLSTFHLAKNGFHDISVQDIEREPMLKDIMQQNLLDMFTNDNPFFSTVANNIVKYAVVRTGLQGGYNSLSGLIHPDIYATEDYNLTNILDDISSLDLDNIANSVIYDIASKQTPYYISDTVYSNEDLVTEYEVWNIPVGESKKVDKNSIYTVFKDTFTDKPIKLLYNPENNESKFVRLTELRTDEGKFDGYEVYNLGVAPQNTTMYLNDYRVDSADRNNIAVINITKELTDRDKNLQDYTRLHKRVVEAYDRIDNINCK